MRLEWPDTERGDGLRLVGCDPGALTKFAAMSPDELPRALPVYPAAVVAERGAAVVTLAPMAGSYVVDAEGVRFLPRHAFLEGTSYTILVALGDLGTVAATALTIERPRADISPTTRIDAIYPRVDRIPRNHLRLYVSFSAPMSEGSVAEHVRVRNAATGEAVLEAFLPTDPELWDAERRRVTVLFDPARLKRGLVPHEELGYPLEEGVPVEIVVDAGFRDAAGRPLIDGGSRSYDVGPDVRALVDPAGWGVRPPAAGSTDALVVAFDRPLDHALLPRCLGVVDCDGALVDGVVTIGPGQASWELAPRTAWKPGAHALVVQTILEDLAGNSVSRVFDRELGDAAQDPRPEGTVRVGFTTG